MCFSRVSIIFVQIKKRRERRRGGGTRRKGREGSRLTAIPLNMTPSPLTKRLQDTSSLRMPGQRQKAPNKRCAAQKYFRNKSKIFRRHFKDTSKKNFKTLKKTLQNTSKHLNKNTSKIFQWGNQTSRLPLFWRFVYLFVWRPRLWSFCSVFFFAQHWGHKSAADSSRSIRVDVFLLLFFCTGKRRSGTFSSAPIEFRCLQP